MQYIIDGYNLLHKTNLESRDELIKKISDFCHSCNKNAKVVFDGDGDAEFASTRVQVVFAGDADAEIIRLLNEAQTPTFYTLVSSDNELREVAKRKKIKIIKAEDFDFSAPDKQSVRDKPTCYLNDDEIKKQLKEFNYFKN
ncbi:MAG: hypothetical protein UT32_C0005G0018 [Parcubacteria group bacterium GW2011_GWC2_39_14]|nr:MAG: hypothetical protein UT32_C0005G0018 [Parcubacteria group bacterium GW2011_GWC2_39_14]KKR54599.1 MAG: hypothetical protein UT91_C0012G0018 [Parcubacteria group bacterium GW2011_GWA2_40_23]